MLTRRTLLALLLAVPVAGLLWSEARAATEQKQDQAAMQAQMQAAAEGSMLSASKARQLERQSAQQPDDLVMRSRLLGYYLLHRDSAAPQTREQHILWLIRHAPAAWITGSPFAVVYPGQNNGVLAQARQAWTRQTQAHPTDAAILGNGAAFYTLHDEKRAIRLYQQAQTLEPTNPEWAKSLGQIFKRNIAGHTGDLRRQTAQQALTQFETWDKYTGGEDAHSDYSPLASMATAAFEAQAFNKARVCAKRLLDFAASDPDAGNSTHHGNLILGRLALRDGDKAKACAYLLAAGRTIGSPQLDSFGPNMMLAKDLLAQGERQAVLDYFGLCGKFWKNAELQQWTEEVTSGQTPDFGPNLIY